MNVLIWLMIERLLVENLKISYDKSNLIVNNLSFTLKEGELLLLIGNTGTGKTSILNVLAGNIPRLIRGKAEGLVLINGKDPRISSPQELVNLVGLVPQEPSAGIIGDSVESELLLSTMYSRSEIKLGNFLERFDLLKLYKRATFTLSSGEMQKLAITSRIILGNEVLLLDEPTTFLDEESRIKLLEVIKTLLKEGKSIIITGHEEGQWKPLASKVIKLPYNKKSVSKEMKEIEFEELKDQPFIEITNLEHKYYPENKLMFKELNLKISGSKLVLIRGPNGCGKSTLLKIISGIIKPRKGTIKVSHPLLFIPDNPLLYFSKPLPIEELEPFLKNVSYETRNKFYESELFKTRIKYLSSGERRLVSLISAALSGRNIILLDEPTVGLDPELKNQVLELFKKLAESGRLLIIASHDKEVERISNEIIDMKELRYDGC